MYSNHIISTIQDLEKTARYYGLLPFFSNNIPGFSIEEMAAPGKLFGGFDGNGDGCWEWKGPVIQEQTTAYGKFFRRKAGFVSLELFPDFINYRRNAYPISQDSIEASLLNLITTNESATSAELRSMVFGKPNSNRKANDLVDTAKYVQPKRQALEAPLQKLQMSGRLLIADFEYKHTRQGERYGWGVALYTTPELWFGKGIAKVERTPEESFNRLVDYLSGRLPEVDKSQIVKLLK